MRLVLCDDNRIFCEALAVALEARGHRALAIATTADESVAAVARYLPDGSLEFLGRICDQPRWKQRHHTLPASSAAAGSN